MNRIEFRWFRESSGGIERNSRASCEGKQFMHSRDPFPFCEGGARWLRRTMFFLLSDQSKAAAALPTNISPSRTYLCNMLSEEWPVCCRIFSDETPACEADVAKPALKL